MVIWVYGIWPYGHMAIWPYGHKPIWPQGKWAYEHMGKRNGTITCRYGEVGGLGSNVIQSKASLAVSKSNVIQLPQSWTHLFRTASADLRITDTNYRHPPQTPTIDTHYRYPLQTGALWALGGIRDIRGVCGHRGALLLSNRWARYGVSSGYLLSHY